MGHLLGCAVTIFFLPLPTASAETQAVLEWDGGSPSVVPFDDIIKRCEAYLSLPGGSPDLRFEMALRQAHAYYYEWKHEAALNAVKAALKIRPDHPGALSRLGQIILRDKGPTEEVAGLARQLMKLDPRLPDGPYLLARYHQERGRHQESITYFDKSLELSASYVPSLFCRAYARYELRQYEKCLSDLKSIMSLPPTADNAFPKARLLFAQCQIHLENYQDAAAILAQLQTENVDNLQVNSLLWTCYGRLRRYHSSLIVADNLVRLHPQNERSHWMRSRSLAQTARLDEAEFHARKAIEIDKRNQAAWTTLGIVMHRKGKLQESLDAYQTALEVGEPFVDAIIRAAFVFSTSSEDRSRKPETARDLINNTLPVLKSDDHRCQALLILAIAYAELNETEKSDQTLKEAARIATRFPHLHSRSQRVREVLQRDKHYRRTGTAPEPDAFELDATCLFTNTD